MNAIADLGRSLLTVLLVAVMCAFLGFTAGAAVLLSLLAFGLAAMASE